LSAIQKGSDYQKNGFAELCYLSIFSFIQTAYSL